MERITWTPAKWNADQDWTLIADIAHLLSQDIVDSLELVVHIASGKETLTSFNMLQVPVLPASCWWRSA